MTSIQNNGNDSIGAAGNCAVCDQPSGLKCSNCTKAHYCSKEHQKQHWKIHKQICFPFEVFSNNKFGRYLKTVRDIKPGETVLKEAPIIRVPAQITCPVCVICLQGLNEQVIESKLSCERCGWPVCENCVGKKSPEHEPECELTQARGSKFELHHYFNPHPTYQCLSVLRCLLLKENDPKKWEKFIQLESHCDERRGSVQWRSDREGVAKFIPRFFKCPDKWTEEEILKVAGILQINGHEVPLTDPPHVTIYHISSLVEHSCAPNITKTFTDSGELVFWAPNAIKKGEHLSICYSDALWGTEQRRNHLQQTKIFRCDCKRCDDVTEMGTFYSALKCCHDGCCGLALPVPGRPWNEDWICSKCKIIVPQCHVAKILERSGKDLEAMDKGNLEHCYKYIEHYSKWLPPQHYHISEVKFILAQLIGAGGPTSIQSISEEKLNLKIEMCQHLLKLFKVIAAAESRCLGSLHFELHAGLAELGRRSAQERNNNFHGALEESLKNAEETIRLLQHEPAVLSEGQICTQAKLNVESLKTLLGLAAAGPEI